MIPSLDRNFFADLAPELPEPPDPLVEKRDAQLMRVLELSLQLESEWVKHKTIYEKAMEQ